MQQDQMPLRLVISTWMDERGGSEQGNIRVAKKGRKHFQANGERLLLCTDKKTGVLCIRQARREELAAQRELLAAGKITERQFLITGFVTTATLKSFVGRRRKSLEEHCYVTDGVENLMLGADPEFALVNAETGSFTYASRVPGFSGMRAVLGSDGPLAEVRPPPLQDVGKLVHSIGDILQNNSSAITNLEWLGGATYENKKRKERIVHLGGHIHVGDPKLLKQEDRQATYNRITQILDETVALPLVKIDTPHPNLRRNTAHNGYGRYGRWGDMRAQPGRFEWRVPSGLWLTHPVIAEAVLGTTKAVAEACYQEIAAKGFSKTWVSAPREKPGLLSFWGAMDSDVVSKIINEAKAAGVTPTLLKRTKIKLLGLSTYEKYKAQIDEFIRIVSLSAKDRKRLSLNLKQGWLLDGPLITQE